VLKPEYNISLLKVECTACNLISVFTLCECCMVIQAGCDRLILLAVCV
jgi:hypothetical protein